MVEMVVIDNDVKLDYADVMLVPKQVINGPESRQEVLLTKYLFKFTDTVPIIAANMDHIGTFEIAKVLSKYSLLTCLNKHYTLEELLRFYRENKDVARYTIYSLGSGQADLDKLQAFENALLKENIKGPSALCLDVANAYTDSFLRIAQKLALGYRHYVLMAGNVVTPQRVSQLFSVGVDIVKIGIGPGSVCTTRQETGVGYPQFSALLECVEAARKVKGQICADGGITCPGDMVKAFAGGADFVMIGGQFAGHKEGYSEAELKDIVNGGLPFHGMASKKAQELHNGGLADYRSSEGKEVKIRYRGSIVNTVQRYLNGLRSGMLYVGARTIPELQKDPHFIKVNHQLNGSLNAT